MTRRSAPGAGAGRETMSANDSHGDNHDRGTLSGIADIAFTGMMCVPALACGALAAPFVLAAEHAAGFGSPARLCIDFALIASGILYYTLAPPATTGGTIEPSTFSAIILTSTGILTIGDALLYNSVRALFT